MPETRGIIRRIIERDGVVKISLPDHSGYFQVAAGDAQDDILARLREAEARGEAVSFRYDAHLQITELL